MAGVYIHIPFCKQACYYCNFHFSTSLRYKNDFIAALLNEIKLHADADYLNGAPVETIYFGGGTPSLLEVGECHRILEAISKFFNTNTVAEITLEANPDDISTEKLRGWKQAGINRLSIGIQSLFDEDLQWMNRAHSARDAKTVIEKSRDAGFAHFNVDFIYGTPGLTDERWQYNLQWAVEQGIDHLSCYALTVEPATTLYKLIRQKKYADVNAEQQRRQFYQLMDFAAATGFEHYEISNFAKLGHRSKHNSNYWLGISYLGLGPSAHSFNGTSRQWNCTNNQRYIAAIQQNTIPATIEQLTHTQQLNEYIMTSIRTIEGCSIEKVLQMKKNADINTFFSTVKTFQNRKWLEQINGYLILTRDGKLFADKIAGDLFSND